MVTYLINGRKETFENEADAQAYIKALGPGTDVQLVTQGPSDKTEMGDDWETDDFTTGKDEEKVFPKDAAESADVVSEIPAQDTESTSGDGSLALQNEDYLINGQPVEKEEFEEFNEKSKFLDTKEYQGLDRPELEAELKNLNTLFNPSDEEKKRIDILSNMLDKTVSDKLYETIQMPKGKEKDNQLLTLTEDQRKDVDAYEELIQDTRSYKRDKSGKTNLGPLSQLGSFLEDTVMTVETPTEVLDYDQSVMENVLYALSKDKTTRGRLNFDTYTLDQKEQLLQSARYQSYVEKSYKNKTDAQAIAADFDSTQSDTQAYMNNAKSIIDGMVAKYPNGLPEDIYNEAIQIQSDAKDYQAEAERKLNANKGQLEVLNKRQEELAGAYGIDTAKNTIKDSFKKTGEIREVAEESEDLIPVVGKGLGKALGGTWKMFLSGAVGFPAMVMGKTGSTLTGGDYNVYDAFLDMTENNINYDLVGDTPTTLFKDGELSAKESLALLGDMTGYVAALMGAIKKGNINSLEQGVGKIMKTKRVGGAMVKADKDLIMVQETVKMMALDNYVNALDSGLSKKDAFIKSSTETVATAAIQTIMPDYKVFQGAKDFKQFANKAFKGGLKNRAISQAAQAVGKNFSINFLKEIGEEELEFVFNRINNTAFALQNTELWSDEFWVEQKQLGAGVLMLSGAMGSVGNYKTARSIYSGVLTANKQKVANIQEELTLKIQAVDASIEAGANIPESVLTNLEQQLSYTKRMQVVIDQSPADVTGDEIALLVEKDKLTEDLRSKDPAFTAGAEARVEEINAELKTGRSEKGFERIRKDRTKKAISVADQIGNVKVRESNSSEETEAIIAEIHARDKAAKRPLTDVEAGGYGFYYTDKDTNEKNIVLDNKEIIEDGAINTAAHEVLHHALDVMFKTSKNKTAEMQATNEAVMEYLVQLKKEGKASGGSEFASRMETYFEKYAQLSAFADIQGNKAQSESYASDLAEEGIVLLSEAMLDGDIKLNEGVGTKAKNLARRLIDMIPGLDSAKIEDGKDVFNFIKDYNRSIKKGKLSKRQLKTVKEGPKKGGLVTKGSKKKVDNKKATTKQSMSKKMGRLINQQEALVSMEGIMDAAELDIMKQENQQKIDELKTKEGIQTKASTTRVKSKEPMTLEEADEAYEDALEAWNEAPDNDALEAEVENALKAVAAAKERFDEGMEAPAEVKAEDKSTAKPVREKKDRSTKRYTLTDQAKAKVEPLIEKAQAMNKELIAKEKKLNDEKIAAIRATPETEMTRTEQANAVLQAKANPIRLDKPVELQRIETEIQDRLEKPMGKAVTFFTKLLYDKIPKDAANVIGGRDVYKSAAEARILNIVINEFKKNTVNRAGEKTVNDVEDIIFNRGGLRLLTLATDLGVADSKQGIAGAIDENKVGDYGDWDKAFDDSPIEMDVDGMFRVSSLLGDSGRMAQAMEQVAEFWKDNIGNSPIENFKKLPSLIDNIVADMLNISENVLTARSGNLNKDDYTNALKGITKPYAVFKVEGKEIRVAPEFAKELENRLRNEGKSFERFADQNILQTLFKFLPKLSADDYRYADRTRGRYSGKATGVPKNLVKLTYSGLERGTTGMGNMKARVSKVAYKDVLAAIGGFVNPEGRVSKLANVSGRTPEGQTLLGVIKLMNRMITNDISRNSNMGLDPMTVQDIAAGKNDLMMSMKRPARPMQVSNAELQALLNKYNKNNPKASYIDQINHIHNSVEDMVGDHLAGIFNYDVRTWIKKNDPTSLEAIAKAYDFRWGKFFKYVQEDLSFNNAIKEISTKDVDTPTLEKFFVLYARSIKNKKYKGAMNNQLLWDFVSDNVVGGKKKLKELGFTLRQSRNKKGELGKRFYIDVTKEIKNDKGEVETITEPVSSPLSVTKIKSEHKRAELDKGSIDAVGVQTIEDSDRYTEIILSHLKELMESGQTLRAIADIHTMAQGQLTPIRKLSVLGKVYKFDENTAITVKGKRIKLSGDSILEHVDSVKLMQDKLLDVVNNKMSFDEFRAYVKGQRVDVIPKEVDPKLKVGTKEQKYTAIEKAFLEQLPLYTFDADAYRTGQENEVKAENANEGFAQSMKRTPDTKRKGISVLDFDDTLARTNSNVLYTMPNGKTGKLTAEQFAKDGDRMAAEGAEWDFSEFSKVVDGKKGPLFERTKRLVAKFGNENVFILTARPANSKYAIHEFLSGLGLDIPLQNITGLADSNPQAKGDWITSKAAEGYNDFFFADDHIKNVMAVGQAMDEAGVKGKSILADPSVKYSLKIKRNYINQVTKGRPDLTAQQIDDQMYRVMEYVDKIGSEGGFSPNKLAKYKKLGLHFLAKSPLILPEDAYKIDSVIEVAEEKKIDPFRYNNPNELIDKFAGTLKAKRVDPDNVKEFSNKKELPKGVTVYDVENDRSGQEAVRKVLDTHLNPKANPWCAFARTRITVREQDEYLRLRQPVNVDSAFVSYEFTYLDTGEVLTDYYPMGSINNKINLSREEMEELAKGGFGPGFINAIPLDQQGAQKNDDSWEEVHQDNGRMGRIKYKEYYLLTDRKKTQKEFLDEGGLKYPPAPKTNKLIKDEAFMGYDMFEHYGTGKPGRTVTEEVDGKTKVIKKEDATPGGWKIAFINGKLKSVKNLGSKKEQWWDLRDVATDDLKISKDGPGERTVMNIETGKTKKIAADPSMKWSMKRDKKLNKAIDDVVNIDRSNDSKLKGKASQPKYIKDLLDVFDMDGEGQTLLDQATRNLDLQWNLLYQDVTGVDPGTEFNEVEAQKLGDQVSKGFKSRLKSIMRGYLVESGADDFLGLLYRTLPKGKKGEAMMKLYEENLLKPFAIASREIEKARIKMAKRYRDIKVNNGISDKVLNGELTLKTESGKDITYTSEDAVRVYMWRKQGIKVPGLSEQNELDLAEHVKNSDELYRFTLNLMAKTLPEEFADPSKNWVTGSLKTDYLEGINKAKRKEALRFWSKGIETIFSESNINKLRVQHGNKFVAALENSIERMRTGRNSSQSLDSDTKVMLQFISGAVGNIMFLNTRSAGLQLLSATNFMRAGDNTWGKSLKTMFTKFPTLAKDYKMLMNSDFLLDRRNALKMDVNDSDIARIAEGKGFQGKLARFLQWGYVFTQAADSRAIALGGAVYYRNAYDKLIKQGVDPKTAKEQALLETTEHAQNSQQSSRADKISKQQASTSGRLMLAFANTPMQYNRLVQKAYLDLVNGRGSKGKNLYNIAYYGLAQNLLFTVAQGAMLTAVYGTLFGDDEEEDKLDYNKKVGIANGVLSSWLRGMGIWGNGLNALKQTFMNIHKESKKKRPEYDVAAIKGLTSIMPAVGKKFSNIYTTTKAIDYNKDFLFDVNEGNAFKNYAKMPGVVILGQVASFANIPLDRAQRKLANLIDAVNYAQSDLTKTAGLLFGHSLWTLQSDEEKEADYEEQKARRKTIKAENKDKEQKKEMSPGEIRRYDLKKLNKAEQVDILKRLGRSSKQINKLKKEADRVEAIIKYQNIKKRKDSLK